MIVASAGHDFWCVRVQRDVHSIVDIETIRQARVTFCRSNSGAEWLVTERVVTFERGDAMTYRRNYSQKGIIIAVLSMMLV